MCHGEILENDVKETSSHTWKRAPVYRQTRCDMLFHERVRRTRDRDRCSALGSPSCKDNTLRLLGGDESRLVWRSRSVRRMKKQYHRVIVGKKR